MCKCDTISPGFVLSAAGHSVGDIRENLSREVNTDGTHLLKVANFMGSNGVGSFN